MKNLLRVALVLMIIVWLGGPTYSEVPRFVNYQGLLTSTSGTPLDTTVTIMFILYDDSIGGSALWIESHEDVEVIRGIFQVVLGKEATFELDDFDSPERYLGIKIGLNPVISPRIRVVSVPFTSRALYSDNANSVDGRASAELMEKAVYDSDGNDLIDVNAVDAIGVPIGIVIDWWRPDESFSLPNGFQICDGSMVTDTDSPLYGFALPDLTGLLIMGVSDTIEIGVTGGVENHSHSLVYPLHQHEAPIDHDHPYTNRATGITGSHTHEWDMTHVHATSSSYSAGSHSHWYISSYGPYQYASGYFPGGSAGNHNHTIAPPAYDGRGNWTQASSQHNHYVGVDYPSYVETVLTSEFPDTTLFSSNESILPPHVGLLKIMRIK
ncbi:MAG: hypothetical protein GY841_04800 [FCB group bacterium]|nr:hypothetical protein [FCB group bacterium]